MSPFIYCKAKTSSEKTLLCVFSLTHPIPQFILYRSHFCLSSVPNIHIPKPCSINTIFSYNLKWPPLLCCVNSSRNLPMLKDILYCGEQYIAIKAYDRHSRTLSRVQKCHITDLKYLTPFAGHRLSESHVLQ